MKNKLIGALIVMLVLTLTAISWHFTKQKVEVETEIYFNNRVEEITDLFNKNLRRYIDVLIASRAYFMSSKLVERDEWDEFVGFLDIANNYPGIFSLEFTRYIKDNNKRDFENDVRNDRTLNRKGHPNFNIWPEGKRDEYFVADFIYPQKNSTIIFGLDRGSETAHRKMLLLARDMGRVVATDMFPLPRRNNEPGFIFFLPVYKAGMYQSTIEYRRKDLYGFITAVFHYQDLIEKVISEKYFKEIDFEIYEDIDGASPSDTQNAYLKRLLFDSDTIQRSHNPQYKSLRNTIKEVNIAEHSWYLSFTVKPHVKLPTETSLPWLVLTVGIITNLSLFWVFWSLSCSENRAVLLAEDMTKELKSKNEQLMEAMKIKSKFTSTVSHELRAPLVSIKEGIGIVLDGSAGEINAEQKDFLSLAKKNVDRLHRLINDVLDFSKFDAGKAKFHFEENNLYNVIHEILNDYQIAIKNKGLFLKVDICPDIGKIKFDADKIIQVLTNLINNAIKFTKKGGITISCQKDEIKRVVVICIQDTGFGIKSDDIPKVFQEFQQVGNEEYRRPGGTGLGLAICKEIVEKHGGEIWVESEEGVGSKFIFTLAMEQNGR